MGYSTVFSILIGNPTFISLIYNNKDYDWNCKSRMVLLDGTITGIGTCDQEGEFILDNKKDKSFFSIFNKKKSYIVAYNKDEVNDGFILSDIVYKYLKKHKDFKKCIKNKNLFNLLKLYKPKTEMNKYIGQQDVMIYNPKDNDVNNKMTNTNKLFFGYILDKDLWKFKNPESKSKDGKQNKKRIMKIINNFIKFCCKNNSKNNSNNNNNNININSKNNSKNNFKNKKLIVKRYELKDDTSNKFWTIKYNKNGDFSTIYGKIGTNGRESKIKKSSKEEIKKLIDCKIKKGYKIKI